MTISAALFDFGGVILTSPFNAFAAFEEEHGLRRGFLVELNSTNPDTNAWARLERSEIDVDGFVAAFEDEARAAGGTVDALAVLELLSGDVRPEMVEAVRRCGERLKTALLTNNITPLAERSPATGGADKASVLGLFDVVIESSRVGVRKPDPRFYELACEALRIEPTEAVFLDDLGVNLKPARAIGMTTIKVVDAAQAIAELEAVVGFPLRPEA